MKSNRGIAKEFQFFKILKNCLECGKIYRWSNGMSCPCNVITKSYLLCAGFTPI